MKDVDLGEPTSFRDHVCLGCTQRECQVSKEKVENDKSMFESRDSAGAMEKLPEGKAPGKPETNTVSSWPYDMWETQHSDVDWDYFKILILPVTWKIRNQRRMESCAFLEVARSCPQVGCARNRLQLHTVLRKLK